MIIKIDNIYEFTDWINLLVEKGNVYIVGAGTYGKILGNFLTKNNIPWEGFIDKNTKPVEIDGKKIFPYSKGFLEKDFFIISSYFYADTMAAELKRKNILDKNIFVFERHQDIIYAVYEYLVHWSEYTKKIQKFKNKYLGKRCFIIGNGPSLRMLDLEKLINEYTFACNSIYALYQNTYWRPTFYCADDSVFCKNMMSKKADIQMLTSACEAAFTSIMREGFQYRDSEDIKNLFYVTTRYETDKKTGLPLFSNDCSKQVYASGTVSYLMLQLAIYMGFEKIYLLGMDMTFSVERRKDGCINFNKVDNHLEAIEKEEKQFEKDIMDRDSYAYMADVDLQLDGYKAAKNYAGLHERTIYNATRGGKLEVFERVDFDSLFGYL